MGQASKALRSAHNNMDIDQVHELMEDIAEQQEVASEIADAISNPVGFHTGVDEDDLMRELEELEQVCRKITFLKIIFGFRKSSISNYLMLTQHQSCSQMHQELHCHRFHPNQLELLPIKTLKTSKAGPTPNHVTLPTVFRLPTLTRIPPCSLRFPVFFLLYTIST